MLTSLEGRLQARQRVFFDGPLLTLSTGHLVDFGIQLGQPLFDNRQVREGQLQVDRLDVPPKVNAAIGVWHGIIFERTHHMQQRIGTADEVQQRRRQATPVAAPTHPTDVDILHIGRGQFAWFEHRR